MSSPSPLDAMRQVRPQRRVKILALMLGRRTQSIQRTRQAHCVVLFARAAYHGVEKRNARCLSGSRSTPDRFRANGRYTADVRFQVSLVAGGNDRVYELGPTKRGGVL
jgi:hypothetical protein